MAALKHIARRLEVELHRLRMGPIDPLLLLLSLHSGRFWYQFEVEGVRVEHETRQTVVLCDFHRLSITIETAVDEVTSDWVAA